MTIAGDSGEYEFLTEAVYLSRNVDGMLCEVGLREGMGTKTIIDAACEYRPGSTVISIDPYGSLEYEHREGRFCRLDYTDDMCKQCMADMWAYVVGKDVNWMPFKQTDSDFFAERRYGVVIYNLERHVVNRYSMVHLDGPHGGAAVIKEIEWFNMHMDSGAVIVADDITPDFIDLAPIQAWFSNHNWTEIKLGLKKGIWQKK